MIVLIAVLLTLLILGGGAFLLRHWQGMQNSPASLASRDPETFLRRLPIFASITDDDWPEVRKLLQRQELSPSTVLFREGDKGSSLYIVAAGQVRIFKLAQGAPEVLAEVTPGRMIGEMALLSGQPRTATATATMQTVVYKLERSGIDGIRDRASSVMNALWTAYSWNVLSNHLASGLQWSCKVPEAALRAWFSRQMVSRLGMDERAQCPEGAGMLLVVTGRVKVDGEDFAAPSLVAVRSGSVDARGSDIVATRTAYVVWLLAHPGLVRRKSS
jgi:CRP-like cAMP-binding protein